MRAPAAKGFENDWIGAGHRKFECSYGATDIRDVLSIQSARRRHGRARPLLWLVRRGGDLPRHAGDGRSNGRARRHHPAAREGVRLDHRSDLGRARGAPRPVRADRPVRRRLHQPLRRAGGRRLRGRDDRRGHSRLDGHDAGLGARGAVGRRRRNRHWHGRSRAWRNHRDALVRSPKGTSGRHADGEQRDRAIDLSAAHREADRGLWLAKRARLRRRHAARRRRRRAHVVARPAGGRRARSIRGARHPAGPEAGSQARPR